MKVNFIDPNTRREYWEMVVEPLMRFFELRVKRPLLTAEELERFRVEFSRLGDAPRAEAVTAAVTRPSDRELEAESRGWRQAAQFLENCGRHAEDPKVARIRRTFVASIRCMADTRGGSVPPPEDSSHLRGGA